MHSNKAIENELKYWRRIFKEEEEIQNFKLPEYILNDVSKYVPAKLDIHCIDPLFDEYKNLYEEYEMTLPDINMYTCGAEEMPFKDNTFDFIYSRNALDHTEDPIKVLDETLRVLKPNGTLLIYCYINEGSRSGFTGVHQWNIIDDYNGNVIIWRHDKENCIRKKLQ